MKNVLLDMAFDAIIESGASNLGKKWYLFGSSLNNEYAADIDLLIVYEDASHPKAIRSLLFSCMSCFQLDLIFLRSDEERELDFIQSQKCVPILKRTPKNQIVT